MVKLGLVSRRADSDGENAHPSVPLVQGTKAQPRLISPPDQAWISEVTSTYSRFAIGTNGNGDDDDVAHAACQVIMSTLALPHN